MPFCFLLLLMVEGQSESPSPPDGEGDSLPYVTGATGQVPGHLSRRHLNNTKSSAKEFVNWYCCLAYAFAGDCIAYNSLIRVTCLRLASCYEVLIDHVVSGGLYGRVKFVHWFQLSARIASALGNTNPSANDSHTSETLYKKIGLQSY
ncbi:hypothetical protein M514_05262 [Trichuris suis]|uniref:Uncharacterized protein n=1 Tax=Trichuris suis TaxID=68888 RepID=A0A085M960_9BILA|nr:hypothetical protein M513_05262 [Trichuris suis]KFD71552.1 hypothetical protein M514_05262 [Trichuris suis]